MNGIAADSDSGMFAYSHLEEDERQVVAGSSTVFKSR